MKTPPKTKIVIEKWTTPFDIPYWRKTLSEQLSCGDVNFCDGETVFPIIVTGVEILDYT